MVSACIMTYNQAAFIRDCLDGAVAQKLDFGYEIIIGDDCSTDGTREICQAYAEKYPGLIKLIPRERNLGMAENFIDIISHCSGKYIANCEGDDYWTDPLKLHKQVTFLEENPDYVLCFHQVSVKNLTGHVVEDFITKVPADHEKIETLARHGNYIHTPTVVYRNCITEFPFEFHESPIGDFFLYMMLARHGKLKYMEEKMCVYRYNVGVFSGKSPLTQVKATNKLFTCLLSYLTEDNLKKIIMQRQFRTTESMADAIRKEYTDGFVLNNLFFKGLKFAFRNIANPSKVLKKAKSEIRPKK